MTAYAVVITILFVFPWAVLGVMGTGAAVTRLRSGRPIERRHTRDADHSNAAIPGLARAVPARAGARALPGRARRVAGAAGTASAFPDGSRCRRGPGWSGSWRRARPAMTCRLASAPRRVSTNGWRGLRVTAALAGALLLGFAGVVHAGPELPDRVLAQVPADRRDEVEEILAAPTFERSLHLETVADLPVLMYLLDHPDVNASMARALGIAPYRAVRIGPGHYKGDDGGGNTGTIDIFGSEGSQRVVMERGVSPGWGFGDISGRVVVLVAFFAADGERVRSEVTVWARIDQGVVAAMLRLLTPMLGGFLDGKIREQFGLTIRVAEAASRDTARFCQLLTGESDQSLEQHQTLARMAACPGEMGPTNLRVAAPDGRLLGATGLGSSAREPSRRSTASQQ